MNFISMDETERQRGGENKQVRAATLLIKYSPSESPYPTVCKSEVKLRDEKWMMQLEVAYNDSYNEEEYFPYNFEH